MAGGFLVGTGSGILAAAAVYYTISSSVTRDTANLRSQMHHNANILSNSFDPITPPASSTYVGPAYPYRPSFGDTVRMKWNSAISSAFESVRTTDWSAVAAGVYVGGKEVVDKLINTAQSTSVSKTAPTSVTSEGNDSVVKEIFSGGVSAVGPIKSPGEVSGAPTDLRKDDKIEGSEAKVEFIRKVESGTKRLV